MLIKPHPEFISLSFMPFLPLLFFSFSTTSSTLPPPPSEEDCRLARPDSPNPFSGQCGRYNVSRSISRRRIVGGSDAGRGAFPWQADLNGCGGTVVDELNVITAGQCIQDDKGKNTGDDKAQEHMG